MDISKILSEVYNNILKFNDTNILKSLGYTDLKKLKKRLKLNNTYFSTYDSIYPQSVLNKVKFEYQKPNEKFINESGIYLLLSQSSKPQAKQLSKTLFTEVLPELRKQGKFILKQQNRKR